MDGGGGILPTIPATRLPTLPANHHHRTAPPKLEEKMIIELLPKAGTKLA
jgi:hypothetical protein